MDQLMKMLNDDTTQILLAIVLGIVICWFIFGRNCGNNGFSVGGPCRGAPGCSGFRDEGGTDSGGAPCITFTDDTACRRVPGCNWTSAEDAATGATQQAAACMAHGDDRDLCLNPAMSGGGACQWIEPPAAEPPAPPAAEPPAQPAAEPPALTELSPKEQNILYDMKVMILDYVNYTVNLQGQITISYSMGALGNENEVTYIFDDLTFADLKEIAFNLGLKFTVIENNGDGNNDELIEKIKFYKIGGLAFGDMFRPHIALPSRTKNILYCNADTETLSQDNKKRVDPLKKIRSVGTPNTCPVPEIPSTESAGTEVAIQPSVTPVDQKMIDSEILNTHGPVNMRTSLMRALEQGIGNSGERRELIDLYKKAIYDATILDRVEDGGDSIYDHIIYVKGEDIFQTRDTGDYRANYMVDIPGSDRVSLGQLDVYGPASNVGTTPEAVLRVQKDEDYEYINELIRTIASVNNLSKSRERPNFGPLNLGIYINRTTMQRDEIDYLGNSFRDLRGTSWHDELLLSISGMGYLAGENIYYAKPLGELIPTYYPNNRLHNLTQNIDALNTHNMSLQRIHYNCTRLLFGAENYFNPNPWIDIDPDDLTTTLSERTYINTECKATNRDYLLLCSSITIFEEISHKGIKVELYLDLPPLEQTAIRNQEWANMRQDEDYTYKRVSNLGLIRDMSEQADALVYGRDGQGQIRMVKKTRLILINNKDVYDIIFNRLIAESTAVAVVSPPPPQAEVTCASFDECPDDRRRSPAVGIPCPSAGCDTATCCLPDPSSTPQTSEAGRADQDYLRAIGLQQWKSMSGLPSCPDWPHDNRAHCGNLRGGYCWSAWTRNCYDECIAKVGSGVSDVRDCG